MTHRILNLGYSYAHISPVCKSKPQERGWSSKCTVSFFLTIADLLVCTSKNGGRLDLGCAPIADGGKVPHTGGDKYPQKQTRLSTKSRQPISPRPLNVRKVFIDQPKRLITNSRRCNASDESCKTDQDLMLVQN
jgi:hypothetical protein